MSYSTITGACSAIGYRHRDQGLADPTAHQVVARVRRGLRRIVGVAPRRQARPLTTGDVRQILTRIDRATAPGARDAALILLGFSATLRRSELAALELGDVASKPAGLLLTVRRSKADPHSAGQIVAVAAGRHADTDPVAALEQWLVVRGAQPGPLLTRVRYPDRVTCEAISGQAVATVIRSRAEAAGLPGLRITGHSLRAGTPRPPQWPAWAWTGSPHRPATARSRSWCSTTSDRWKHWRIHPVAASVCEPSAPIEANRTV